MKQLKFFMFILLAISIFSCYSTVPDCPDCDGDIIWELAGNLPHSNIWNITITNAGNIWAYNNYESELYLSTNNGDTWNKKDSLPWDGNGLGVNPKNGHLFVSSIYYGLYRSTDDGANWEYLMDSMNYSEILFIPSGEMYVGVHNHGREKNKHVYYSNDNGNTWINKSRGLPNLVIVYSLTLGNNGALYAISSDIVYRSTNGGNSWLPFSPKYTHGSINSLTFCDDGSIFATVNTVEWDYILLKSKDKGVNWTQVNIGDLAYRTVSRAVYNPVTKDIFVIVSIGGGFDNLGTPTYCEVYRSVNSGKDWKLINTGYPNKNGNLAVNPKTGQMFIGTRDGVYRTKNYLN